ncbi:hypothetical protein SAMN04487931_101148 [Desulfobacula phenolica]|uniref:Uncharacterized protein n=1 Tax=Desulfobacula phenolica TaxID=90732 RepID=A0A1H2DN70_9BACT|nr:hypothetical protein SAMN04487931_101148 [Desulfobacula phenolica]
MIFDFGSIWKIYLIGIYSKNKEITKKSGKKAGLFYSGEFKNEC